MKKLLCLILTVCLLYITTIAQINLPAGGSMSQNFDGMPKTAKASLPPGWKAGTSIYPEMMISYFSAGTSTAFSAGASMASNASGGIYNFGAGDPDVATDRAIGGLSTSTAGKSVIVFVSLYNSGDDTIGSYTISYDVEKYRNGSNSKGFSVKLWYSTDGTEWRQPGPVFTSSFPADANNEGSASVPISTQSVVSKTLTLFYTVPPKTTFYLAWLYSVTSDDLTTSTANAQALGIDNVSVSAKAKVSPPVLKAGTLNGFGNICIGTTSAPNSFTLTGTNLNGTPVTIGPLTGYSFSTSATGSFTNTLSPSYSGSSLSATVYVKFSPVSVQSYSDNIPVSGGNAAAINIAASGAGVNTRPTVSTGNATNITFESATTAGTITNVGCSAVTSYGIEYSTVNGFANGAGTPVSSSNLNSGTFSSVISQLSPSTVYYYHAYATNSGGTSYGTQKSFTTTAQPIIPLEVIAVAATDTMPTSFTANWHPATGNANSYRLDVSTTNNFDQNTYVPGYKDLLVVDTSKSVTGLSPNTTYYYRVRATDGNTVSENSNIISVTTTEEEEPLPPTSLLSFSGERKDSKNVLTWKTANETNNQGFYIQRSSDSIHFQTIHFTPSASPDGNSIEPIEYEFDDNNINAGDSQFYRLQIVAFDETISFSDTILLGNNIIPKIGIDMLYPNPATGTINAVFSSSTWEKVSFWIVDARGNIVKQFTLNPVAGSNIFTIDLTGVLPGTYHLKCISQTGMVDTRKFMVR